MNRSSHQDLSSPRFRHLSSALIGALALALLIPRISLAQAPAGAMMNGKPLVAESDTLRGATSMAADAAVATEPGLQPILDPGISPVRVWTTDRYGRARSSFARGELIAFWVRLYNPSRSYARYNLELWVDDQIRCITTPCPHGPMRIFAGTVTLAPGYTSGYRFARAERDDKVGEWNYWATDPERLREAMTRFYLR